MSKRVWDISVANWKARLHLWDDNNPKEALAKLTTTEGSSENTPTGDVPQIRRSRRVEPVQLSTSLSTAATTSPSLAAYQTVVGLQKVEETTNDDI